MQPPTLLYIVVQYPQRNPCRASMSMTFVIIIRYLFILMVLSIWGYSRDVYMYIRTYVSIIRHRFLGPPRFDGVKRLLITEKRHIKH